MNEQHQPQAWSRPEATPRHIAIIMDGNGRWAQSRGLPRTAGHRGGVEAVRRTVRAALELGIPYLTLFSFSSENWARPASEIDDLMGLMKRFVRRDLADLHENGVRVRVIGERKGVDRELLAMIDEGVALTGENKALNLTIAFNYGSRAEIAGAARQLAQRAVEGSIKPDDITPELLAGALDTQGIPDPDLLIRTSGELRLSNFLLWQSAYTEFVFLEACWPEFGRELLVEAMEKFRRRDRRFGGLTARSIG
jgi:undecaprenyl diphosphate synthase